MSISMEVRGLLQGGLVEAVQLMRCRTSDVKTGGVPIAVGCGPRSTSRSKDGSCIPALLSPGVQPSTALFPGSRMES